MRNNHVITKRFRPLLYFLITMLSLLKPVSDISNNSGVSIAGATQLTRFCSTFTDVYEDDYFCWAVQMLAEAKALPTDTGTGYEYFCLAVQVLASVGAITDPPLGCSAYILSSSSFFPNREVSRGEFIKMLVQTHVHLTEIRNNGEWLLQEPVTPTFSDVHQDSDLYKYVETAYSHGVMAGYGDPECSKAGLTPPCFFPSNKITRGQMAKMVSNAAKYNDSTEGREPSYADVSSDNPFFKWIERLVMHGSVGPPMPGCDSISLPCFLPTTGNSSRAESALYIYLTAHDEKFRQVFASINGSFTGIDVYITTPTTTVSVPRAKIGAPVAMTTRWNGKFVEAGPFQDCRLGCTWHPYRNWGNFHTDLLDEHVDTSILLSPGGSYEYKIRHLGGGQWQPEFCDYDGCRAMLVSGIVNTTLPYTAVGVESTNINQPVGMANILFAGALSTIWSPWCYDPTLAPWRTFNSSIGPCSNYTWAVND